MSFNNLEVLSQSFERVKHQSTEFASSFYKNLFNDHSQLQPLFAATDMAKQQKMLMSALSMVIDNLRQPDSVRDKLKELGARHVNYGTVQEYYPMLGDTLLKTLKSYLGTDWTPELKQAWVDAYGEIASMMLEGEQEANLTKKDSGKNTSAVVAKVNELQDGEMKLVSIGQTKILLVRTNGKFHALEAYCTHQRGPLLQGVLSKERLVCPWHQACFNVTTGKQEEPPGLDDLPTFEVRVEGENVIVSAPSEAATHRIPPMAKHKPDVDRRTFVIIGAGAAGITAAQTLRQDGFVGRIVMLTREDHLPCDRTEFSKKYLQGKLCEKSIQLRSEEFYSDYDIELCYGKSAARVDAAAKMIVFDDDSSMNYDALLLATGSNPRHLDVPGADLENIFVLRSLKDAKQILAAAKQASRVVVIGASFIGMEVAACLTQLKLPVTVVAPGSAPLERVLGAQVGQMIQQVHEEHGVSFRLGTKATRFEGSGKVEAVVLDQDQRLDADLVVLGVGVEPATELLHGVKLHPDDRSVPVDEYLCATEGLYAAGDIARFLDWRTGEATRIEHWRLAAQHGRIAAHNMAGLGVKFAGVPFFWTKQFALNLRYVGHATEWDEIIFQGDLATRKFIAFYVKDNQVLAAASCKRDTQTAAIAELMRLNQMPTPSELRSDSIDLVGRLKTIHF